MLEQRKPLDLLVPIKDMRVPGDENVAPESSPWMRYVRL